LKTLVAIVACGAIALPAATAHADASSADLLGYVNAQRASAGLPVLVADDSAADQACAAWAGSDPRGASPAHSLEWAPPGTLTFGGSPAVGVWTPAESPFETDAAALPLLLAPRLAAFGAAEAGGWGCAVPTLSGPAADHDITYGYPADGTTDAHTSQPLVTSGPLWDGTTHTTSDHFETGSVVYAFFDGPDFGPFFDAADPATARATAWSLTGPDGVRLAVDVRDADTPSFTATGLPTEVQLVPRAALQPFTKYTASVTADVTLPDDGPTRSFTKTWSFTTGALENSVGKPWIAGQGAGGDPSSYFLELYSRAPQVTVTATGPGTTTTGTGTSPLATYIGAQISLHLDRPGTWHFCATSGGSGTNFRAASYCWDDTAGVTPKAPPVVTVPAPKPAKLVVSVPKGTKAKWHGRTLTVAGLRCSATCSLKVGGKVEAGGKTTKLRTVTVSRRRAGTVTVKYTLSKTAARRLRAARTRRVVLTIVPKGGTAVHAALPVTVAK
jgi:hypothetical protein